MTWILITLFAQVMNAAKNVLTRRLGDGVDTYSVAFVSTVLMLPFLWLSVFLSGDFTVEARFLGNPDIDCPAGDYSHAPLFPRTHQE